MKIGYLYILIVPRNFEKLLDSCYLRGDEDGEAVKMQTESA